MKKTVCILRSNPVRPDSRVEKEACALVDEGYAVKVLAWDRDSNHAPNDEMLELGKYRIPITRLGHIASFGEGMKNLKSYLAFQFEMQRWLLKNRKSIDAVHACDFDTAWFSYPIAKLCKKKFVFDIFDFLYGEPHGFLQKSVKKAQCFLINHSDATIICTDARKQQISGTKPKQLAVIENTPSSELCNQAAGKMVAPSNRVKVAYVGILQDYRLLPEILEYFAHNKEIEFHCGGFGKYEDMFCKYSAKYDNIFFYGRLTYADTIQLERDCDIMLAIYDPSLENHRMAAPNKFYESLMLGKPVIMVKGTGMADEVERYGLGAIIEYSLDGFAQGIDELIGRQAEFNDISLKARALYRDCHSWDKMKDRIAALYRSVI